MRVRRSLARPGTGASAIGETALGAASHMGNRPIAEYLISRKGRASVAIFRGGMLGQLDVVKAFVAAQPGVHRIRGPHSISLLAHAKAGGGAARPMFEFLQFLGDADAEPPEPLTESENAAMVGTYIFGVGVAQQIDVTSERRQGMMSMYSPLTWTRKGTMARPLFHLGGHAFYPAGAPSVPYPIYRGHGWSGYDRQRPAIGIDRAEERTTQVISLYTRFVGDNCNVRESEFVDI